MKVAFKLGGWIAFLTVLSGMQVVRVMQTPMPPPYRCGPMCEMHGPPGGQAFE